MQHAAGQGAAETRAQRGGDAGGELDEDCARAGARQGHAEPQQRAAGGVAVVRPAGPAPGCKRTASGSCRPLGREDL